jgi:transcriptional regulator of acetoin/glycerol metabolism
MQNLAPKPLTDRLQCIERARSMVIDVAQGGGSLVHGSGVAAWIERSWQRCLHQGQRPEQRVVFEPVSAAALRRTAEVNQRLVQAARPVLGKLGHAMADTHYFAILTNAQGVVIDAHGPIDRSDRRADLITRVGVDLSERNIGTSAIGAALHELQPVWLHRGEHFYHDTSVYSCAGAPLIGPDGRCVGMLDLTGVDAVERPELRHLVAQSARSIENALVLDLTHALLVHINWPGRTLGEESDGLVCLDADGWVMGMNQAAQQMLGAGALREAAQNSSGLHANDVFALPYEMLFDAGRAHRPCLEVPLWSGLRLNAQALMPHQSARRYGTADSTAGAAAKRAPLKDIEVSLIHQAVREARGNVAQAARALGISRATVYRKILGKKPA